MTHPQQQLIADWKKRADVLRDRTEPDASSHYFRNGQVWAYQQVADELEATLSAGAVPQSDVPVFCAHCEHEIHACPSCGKMEWRIAGAVPQQEPQEPATVCLSGSSRFIDVMAVVAWELEKRGHVTMHCNLLPDWYTHTPHHLAEEQGVAERLDAVHLRKIDIADELLVIDVLGYIGESTRREIAYAANAGKPVRYLSQDESLLALLPHPAVPSLPAPQEQK